MVWKYFPIVEAALENTSDDYQSNSCTDENYPPRVGRERKLDEQATTRHTTTLYDFRTECVYETDFPYSRIECFRKKSTFVTRFRDCRYVIDYRMMIYEKSYDEHWLYQGLEQEHNLYSSSNYSEDTDVDDLVILDYELMEPLHGIESTPLLATFIFILAAFGIRIVSEEEFIKDTLSDSKIAKITTKEERQNFPTKVEEGAFRHCGFCINHNQAIAYCKTCKLYICMPCNNLHKRVWAYINHTVCPFNEM